MKFKSIKEIEDIFRTLGYGMILEDKNFVRLKKQEKHFMSNTYDHSLRTAYIMYVMSEDKRTIPIGLFHDFCDRPKKDKDFKLLKPRTWWCFTHGNRAAENAIGAVVYYETNGLWKNKRMESEDFDAIRTHMFPLGPVPKSKNAWLITVADKIAAIIDAVPALAA